MMSFELSMSTKKWQFNFRNAILIFSMLLFFTQCNENEETAEKEEKVTSFLAQFEFTGEYLDISAETENSRATHWKPDGSMVFITGRYSNNVAAYAVSEAWEIGSATFSHAQVVPGEFQHGLFFHDSGEKLWVFDRTSIWTLTLEEAWNLHSLSDSLNTDLSSFVERGHDVDFKPDGSYIFIDDRNTGAVFAVSLSTPWDITTKNLEYTLDISDIQVEVRGIEFVKNGKMMILMDTGRDEVLEFHLSEPYDISTAELVYAFDVSSQTNQGRGLSFNADETSFYITGRDEEKVFQYRIVAE
ncbi:MAG: hypothetical protein EA412_00815 [Chitinophagaceae bacterium]|nr:MAG: hypothetical protein EA412_00815 [Chitinophagaceae bacterium]